MKRGQTKRIWTKEQKLAIIKRYYEEHISTGPLANIKRSMPRAGTPTDNPIIESLNG